MPEWIRREQRGTTIHYQRTFEYADRPGAGFGFDCDENGVVVETQSNHENYLACLAGVVDGFVVIDAGIQRFETRWTEPGVIRCVNCGAEVELNMVMTNTCEACLTCGQPEDFGWHHLTAEQCEAYMQAHEGRGCSNPAEHHEYRGCFADYNSSGQQLAPREQWGWDTGESLDEILSSDWPVGVSRELWAGEE